MDDVIVELDSHQQGIGTLVAIVVVGPCRGYLGRSGWEDVVGVEGSGLPFPSIGRHELAELSGAVDVEEIDDVVLFDSTRLLVRRLGNRCTTSVRSYLSELRSDDRYEGRSASGNADVIVRDIPRLARVVPRALADLVGR